MGQAEDRLADGRHAYSLWQATGSQQSLDAAIGALRSALPGPWRTAQDAAQCLAELVQALSAGAQAGSDRYTTEVIDLMNRVIPVAGQDDPVMLGTRGFALMLRYTRHGSLDDLNAAVLDFKKSLAATPAGDIEKYRRVLNVAWASEARFDRLRARSEQYLGIQVDGVERLRGPRDLVHPIFLIESLLGPDNVLPPAPPGVVPQLKRNLGNLLSRYAQFVAQRPLEDRKANMNRAVTLLQEALTETEPGSFDHSTTAQSLVAAVQQGRAARLLSES